MDFKPTAQDLNISDKQFDALKQFRELVCDKIEAKHDDYYLVRWLIARNFDLKKAEDMLLKHLEWRKEWKADTILTDWEVPEVLTKYYPGGLIGYDKLGCPVWLVESARFDMKGTTLSLRRGDFMRFVVWLMEKLQSIMDEQSKKLGKKINQVMFINDMSGFTMANILQPGMDQMPKMMQLVEANYPEYMKVSMIINAPRVFPILYGIMKPFMSESTKSKIKLHGSNYLEDILKMVDADSLPKHWGGNVVDEFDDPRCASMVPRGGKVPESYYLKGEDIVGEADVTTVTVRRGSNHDVSFTVNETKKLLKWVFWTIHYDIKFAVFYRETEDDKKVALLKPERINAHQIPVDGWLTCDKPGIYFIRFDNTYSWVHNKEIHFAVTLVNTESEQDQLDRIALQPLEAIAAEEDRGEVQNSENENLKDSNDNSQAPCGNTAALGTAV